MGRILTSFLFVGLLQLTYSAAIKNLHIECKSDADCDSNHYCYLESNLCAKCKKDFCARVNRADSSYLNCHREYSDCGSCLPGYEEEILSDGSPRAPCIRSISLPLTKDPEDIRPSNYTMPFLIGSSLLIVLTVIGYVYFSKRKTHNVREGSCNQSDEAIPLNDFQDCKSEPYKTHFVSTEPTVDARPPAYNPTAPLIKEFESKGPTKTILNVVEVNVHSSSGGTQESANQIVLENSLKEKCEPTNTSTLIPVHNIVGDQRIKVVENRAQAVKFKDADYENEALKYDIAEESFPTPPTNEPEEADFDVEYHNQDTQESTWRPLPTESTGEGASCTKTDEVPTKKKKLELGTNEDEPDLASRPFKRFSREKEE